MRTSEERAGVFFAALCALNGAFVPAIAKLTTNAGDAFFVAMATTVFGGLAALGVLLVRGEVGALFNRRHGPLLFLVGSLGSVVAFLLFFAGAQRASAIEATLCLQSEPVFALLIAWLGLGETPTRRRLFAVLAIVAGVALAIGSASMSPSLGVWLLLVTPLSWQLSHLVVLRGLRGVSPQVLSGARYIYGGLALTAIWLLLGGWGRLPDWQSVQPTIPLLALQGVVLSYMGTTVWYAAVVRLDLARTTAIVVPSIPLLSIGSTFLLLGESPTPMQWLGLLTTASGVFAFATGPAAISRHRATHTDTPADSSAASLHRGSARTSRRRG